MDDESLTRAGRALAGLFGRAAGVAEARRPREGEDVIVETVGGARADDRGDQRGRDEDEAHGDSVLVAGADHGGAEAKRGERPKHAAGRGIGVLAIEADDAPLDPVAPADDAQVLADIVDHRAEFAASSTLRAMQ